MTLLGTLLVVTTLTASGELSGRVRAAQAPVAGVEVVALKPAMDWGLASLTTAASRRAFVREAPGKVTVLGRARTGKDGRFRLAGLPPGDVVLWARADARGQAVVAEVAVGRQDVVVPLGEAFLLDGDSAVRATENYPYPQAEAGLRVVAVHATLPLVARAVTDARGRFSLGHVPAGRYVVVGDGPGVLPARVEVTLPAPPPAAPKARPEPTPEAPSAPHASPGELFFSPPRRGPPPRLGPTREEEHTTGLVHLPFLDAVSLAGAVTVGKAPASAARVELRHGAVPASLKTDGRGRFALPDSLGFGQPAVVEVTAGARTLRACVLAYAEVGDTGCCSPDPRVHAEVESKETQLTCRVTVDLGAAAGPADSSCACDVVALDGLEADAGVQR